MYKGILTVALVAATCAAANLSISASQRQDEAQIRELQARQAAAWNIHDATAYANLFTENGDVVNVVGWWWKGRREIESKLTAAFAFAFKASTLTIADVQVRFVKPDLALAHVRWTMTGARTPPGVPEPREGIQLQILKKQRGKWLIESFQNTSSVPEVPFPTGPPAPISKP
ncbi:MAG TPA: SgcJ/EcaC family oxidoreductase [Pyrinomonadaceae bacterium]|nr:SgcJ/EcaC family oxidoreductase [Pyrinomonadaceae bacterium]